MSDLDLSAAVEAAARAAYSARYDAPPEDWDEMSEFYRRGWIDEVRVAITAAAPHIERQVREQVAREIYAAVARTYVATRTDAALVRGAEWAARIARGGTS